MIDKQEIIRTAHKLTDIFPYEFFNSPLTYDDSQLLRASTASHLIGSGVASKEDVLKIMSLEFDNTWEEIVDEIQSLRYLLRG